ncbi:hypothetical protein [Evansella tamaricis]|uniref:Uncharacterized protein n=1 Tax=Evansella tamaricis TaxID=2069301 RepID=A0ABS6JBN6_9BACI|nr:hypothetical protein [Evansella tamaricis]MBU9711091.1 hypothetical protein [Evansella tamaricis]
MLKRIFHEGKVLSELEATPVEQFILDRLEDIFEMYLSGEADYDEAKRMLAFLILLQPYMEQEAPTVEGW